MDLSLSLNLGAVTTSLKGAPVDPYAGYLLYDDFGGAVAPLAGRTPNKGPAWAVTGASAAGMTAGGGVMEQAAGDNSAGYALPSAPYGQVPQKIVGEWRMTSGDFAYPATMAIHVDSSLVPMLHGEGGANNFYIRLYSGTWLEPMLALFGPNWTLETNTPYRDELHYDGGKMAAMVKRAENGDIIGQELIYDFRLPSFVGELSFWETLTNRIEYTLATAEATSDYPWPVVTEKTGLVNPTTADVVPTAFGGTTTNSSSGIVITGAGYGQGGQNSVGAVDEGQSLQFVFDASELTSSQIEVALLKTGAMETEKSNIVYFAANGRISGVLTATETMADASLAIAISPIGSAGQVKVANLQTITPPITGF